MSGGSRRLWNQLLRGTPLFLLSFSGFFRSALVLAALFGPLRSPPPSSFHSVLFIFSLTIPSTFSPFVTYAQPERFIPYRKKLLGQSRRADSAKGQPSPSPGPPAYVRILPLSSYNLRQLPRMTDSTAEIGPLTVRTCPFLQRGAENPQ